MRKIQFVLCLCGLGSSLLLAACGNLWGNSGQAAALPSAVPGTPSLTPFQPEGFTPPPADTVLPASTPDQPDPTSTSLPASLWMAASVPEALRQLGLASGLPLAEVPDANTASLDLSGQASDHIGQQNTVWYYAVVTPFPTLTDDVSIADIKKTWAGTPSGPFAGRYLWLDNSTFAAFTALWGPSASGAVRVVDTAQLVDEVWADRPAWAIVPFEALEPRWKVLSVDGQSPIHNDFDPSKYPLQIPFSFSSTAFSLPSSNRDPGKLTLLAMTGVTALVRATADRMESHGVLYPGEEVRSVLRAADLTHVSNEISFDPHCPTPDPWTESLRFCSDPRYIALLQDVGVDIVELTGNHLLDYGPQDLSDTLDMYDQLGWNYFGGGRDLQAALRPALLEDHGNKLAFVGCNFAGPPDDWAKNDRPGSTPCDLDNLSVEISQLRGQGYLPVMTYQYNEYYQPDPTPEEQADFRRMADAGAIIVSGSQAHMPASMEFHGSSFIHYGLGNLFFDQMSHLMPDGSVIYDTRNVFIDRHIIYDGRYIGTELLTYIIEDYARPRLMTTSERNQFLKRIFTVAGW
jgi:hypothetical protein